MIFKHINDIVFLVINDVTVNWNDFIYKHNGRVEEKFQQLCDFLFCRELNIEKGLFAYANQPAIETQPVYINGKIIGYQAKFYTSQNSREKELKDCIDNSLKLYSLTNLYFYIYQTLPYSTKNPSGKTKEQERIETYALDKGITITWKSLNDITYLLSLDINKDLRYSFFHVNNNRIKGLIENVPEGIAKYYFASEWIDFQGRKNELKILDDFCTSEKQFAWCIVSGSAGTGKSRLANHYKKNYLANWDKFFAEKIYEDFSVINFQSNNDTLIFVDYVAGREHHLAKFIEDTFEMFYSSIYKLRVVMIERNVDGNWYNSFQNADLGYNWSFILEQQVSENGQNYLIKLTGLSLQETENIISNVFKNLNYSYNNKEISAASKVFFENFSTENRTPLFLQMFALAWIDDNTKIQALNSPSDITEYIIKKEETRWKQIIKMFIRNNNNEVIIFDHWKDLICFIAIIKHIHFKRLTNYPEPLKEAINAIFNFVGGKRNDKEHEQKVISFFVDMLDIKCSSFNSMIFSLNWPDYIIETAFIRYFCDDFLLNFDTEGWFEENHLYEFLLHLNEDFPDQNIVGYKILDHLEKKNEIAVAGKSELKLFVKAKYNNEKALVALIEKYQSVFEKYYNQFLKNDLETEYYRICTNSIKIALKKYKIKSNTNFYADFENLITEIFIDLCEEELYLTIDDSSNSIAVKEIYNDINVYNYSSLEFLTEEASYVSYLNIIDYNFENNIIQKVLIQNIMDSLVYPKNKILKLFYMGYSFKEISTEIDLSVKEIERYFDEIKNVFYNEFQSDI